MQWWIDGSQADGCGRVLLAPQLGIRKILSDTSTTLITFTPERPGDYAFNCGMGMMTPDSKITVLPNTKDKCRDCHRLLLTALRLTRRADEGQPLSTSAACIARPAPTATSVRSRSCRAYRRRPSTLRMRNARVEFDPATVSERALHEAVVGNGFQVLTKEFAQENKERAAQELSEARLARLPGAGPRAPRSCSWRCWRSCCPGTIAGRNASLWVQAILSSIVILGLGWEFHRGMVRLAVRGAANMDTLISLGTLSALALQLLGAAVPAISISISKPAPSLRRSSCSGATSRREAAGRRAPPSRS